MQNLNLDNYRNVLEIPRIDDKQIVYTFNFWNNSWGQVDFLDLKDNKGYEGKFLLVKDGEDSEVLIHFHCDGCGFFNPQVSDEVISEQILGFNSFINFYTTPYITEKG